MAMEEFALRDEVQLASDLSYRRVIIETDAFLVVCQWNTPSADRLKIATTLKETQELCGNFEEFRLVFMAKRS